MRAVRPEIFAFDVYTLRLTPSSLPPSPVAILKYGNFTFSSIKQPIDIFLVRQYNHQCDGHRKNSV